MSGQESEAAPEDTAASAPSPWRARRRRIGAVLIVLGAAVIIHMWYVGSHIDDHTYTPAELEGGSVIHIISWPKNRTAVQACQLMPFSADQVWQVVSDQESFQDFMPYVRYAAAGEEADGALKLKQVLKLPHATYESTLRMETEDTDNVRTMRWRQLEGPVKFNEGAWVVEQHGDKCVLRYQLSASVSGVPQWLANYLMKTRLARIPAAIEARVLELQNREGAGS